MKRRVFWLEWSPCYEAYVLREERTSGRTKLVEIYDSSAVVGDITKAAAVAAAAKHVRSIWAKTGKPTQLKIRNRDGSISKGNAGERTYGDDPRRSRG